MAIFFDAAKEKYELAEIDSRVVLFTNTRLDRDSVPDGLFCYDVRDSDNLDGSIAEIKPHVMVNHWGTILCHETFPLDEHESYYPHDWSFLDRDMSLEEFAAASPESLTEYLQSDPRSVEMNM